jgi:hypothetical protein
VFKEERTWNLGGSEKKVFTLILLLNIEPIKIIDFKTLFQLPTLLRSRRKRNSRKPKISQLKHENIQTITEHSTFHFRKVFTQMELLTSFTKVNISTTLEITTCSFISYRECS